MYNLQDRKDRTEIQITPQMIEAGDSVLLHLQECVPTSYLLAEVYKAMARAGASEQSYATLDAPLL